MNPSILPQDLINAALSLGYDEKDLYPLSYEQIQKESQMILKNMKPKQKQFYINKKIMLYEARRAKLLKQAQIHAILLNKKGQKINGFNQKVKQIVKEHQKSYQNHKRYTKILENGRQRKNHQRKRKLILASNSINIRNSSQSRQYFNRTPYSRTSQASRTSIKSQKSVRSNKSTSSVNSLTKSRLQQVRKKENQAQQFRKKMLQQKIKRDELKFLRAQQNVLTKSRKAKIRSQISQKIVKENKQEIEFIKKLTHQQHLQNKKFQILRSNTTRQNKLRQLSLSKNNDHDIFFVNSAHRDILHSKHVQNKGRYQGKMKNSIYWQQQYNTIQHHSVSFAQQNQKNKAFLAYERRTFDMNQNSKLRHQGLSMEMKRQNDAQKRRNQQLQNKKLVQISKHIKNQLVTKNKKAVDTSHSMRNRALQNSYNQKIRQISYIDKLKGNIKKTDSYSNKRNQFNSQNIQQKTNDRREHSHFERKSYTSNKHRNLLFNSIQG